MKDLKEELGVQSFCFRNYKTNEEVADCVKQIGLKKIEPCSVHVDFNDVSVYQEAIDAYQNNGVEIVSMGVVQLSNNEDEIKPYFEFAKKAGLSHISISFHPDDMDETLKLAEEMAEEYDLYLGIHNHGGHHWLGNCQMLRSIFKKTGKRIGLCLDTAWALDAGEDPVEMAREFFDRLYCIHFKDFLFDRTGKEEDVVVGTGNLDLAALVDLLNENDYQGISILEYEGNVENPVPSLKQCVDQMAKIWK